MKGGVLKSQSRRRPIGLIKGGDMVTVPSERGDETGRVKRTFVGYSYSWVYVEWEDGTIQDVIASKAIKVPRQGEKSGRSIVSD